jgi:hypothetical protein
METVPRGLLLTALWIGLALGFTEVLSNTLHDTHIPTAAPAAADS